MLGKIVRVRVTKPMDAFDSETATVFRLNYGVVESGLDPHAPVRGAFIMGVTHAVHNFDGRVIAVVKPSDRQGAYLVVSPKSKRFIVNEIKSAVEFAFKSGSYTISCLYERSCGAVVFRSINGERRFLLIKNRRSSHWGFPKGHIEAGETEEDTALREVLEETGLHIKLFPGFKCKSEYEIHGKVQKTVLIFLATTNDTETIIQPEEIDDYVWLSFANAKRTLSYPNDRDILESARSFVEKNGI